MIAIIDYGLGNLGSIKNMLFKIGYTDVQISREPAIINSADKLILPGVGAFDNGMQKIHDSGLLSLLNEHALNKKKMVLGICLGMQLLTRKSEEGVLPGLGWIDAETVRFPFTQEQQLKIPHMGWNEATVKKQHPLVKSLKPHSRFYFVHSYYVKCADSNDELLSCNYGIDFTCAVQHENIMGVQFHPEKSHKFGMHLLRNFVEL